MAIPRRPIPIPLGPTHDGDDGHAGLSAADHGRAHARGVEHHHDPGHRHHHHHVPDGPVSLRALVALGVSGGIVPCPAALVVLLSAVAMGRSVSASSSSWRYVGLAAVLIAIGLLVVYARRVVARVGRAGIEGPLVRRWLTSGSSAALSSPCRGSSSLSRPSATPPERRYSPMEPLVNCSRASGLLLGSPACPRR